MRLWQTESGVPFDSSAPQLCVVPWKRVVNSVVGACALRSWHHGPCLYRLRAPRCHRE